MFTKIFFCLFLTLVSASELGCYWNRACSVQLFGSKTPYDTVRGDFRDFKKPEGCEAVSLWSINRHGNRNPGGSVTTSMRIVTGLKDQIVAAYDAGLSQLCATDIDEFRKWQWNSTLESSTSYLTGFGYEELYDLASRIRATYPELLNGSADDYYFRPTNEQRTITSAMAFVHGLAEGTNLSSLEVDQVREVENVIRPYELCDRYQQLVKEGPAVLEAVAKFENSDDYNNIKAAIQKRLGITYQITTEDVYSIYETCRFYRSWDLRRQNPWCAVFTDEDLVVLDYRDDVRHYHRNGYGSWVNEKLGELPMKDLYENLEAAVQGRGKKLVAYFTHDTMMEMVYSALGLYKDPEPLTGDVRNEDRLWRSSYMGSMAINLVAVLNRCVESGVTTHRVQFFIGEKPTELCPVEGCTWEQFQQKFQPFTTANLDFCSLEYPVTDAPEPVTDAANLFRFSRIMLVVSLILWKCYG